MTQWSRLNSVTLFYLVYFLKLVSFEGSGFIFSLCSPPFFFCITFNIQIHSFCGFCTVFHTFGHGNFKSYICLQMFNCYLNDYVSFYYFYFEKCWAIFYITLLTSTKGSLTRTTRPLCSAGKSGLRKRKEEQQDWDKRCKYWCILFQYFIELLLCLTIREIEFIDLLILIVSPSFLFCKQI